MLELLFHVFWCCLQRAFFAVALKWKTKTEYESSSWTKEKKQTSPYNAPLAISVHDFKRGQKIRTDLKTLKFFVFRYRQSNVRRLLSACNWLDIPFNFH